MQLKNCLFVCMLFLNFSFPSHGMQHEEDATRIGSRAIRFSIPAQREGLNIVTKSDGSIEVSAEPDKPNKPKKDFSFYLKSVKEEAIRLAPQETLDFKLTTGDLSQEGLKEAVVNIKLTTKSDGSLKTLKEQDYPPLDRDKVLTFTYLQEARDSQDCTLWVKFEGLTAPLQPFTLIKKALVEIK